MKSKKPKFLQEFLVTQENYISLLLDLDVLTDQNCMKRNLNKKFYLEVKTKSVFPLFIQKADNGSFYAISMK